MHDLLGLFFTLAIGLFIVLGSIIVFVTKNNNKFIHFSISLAFGVMGALVVLELLPETFELIGENYSQSITIALVVGFALVGVLGLKLIDHFIPDHHVHHDEKKDTKDNFFHIGLISSIALILHNIIEGMAVYSSLTSSLSLGVLVSIGVGLHNIPMGMVITSTFYKANNNIRKTMFMIFIISISTFVGGLIMYFNSGFLINDTILGILLSITMGMLIYIIIFELLPHIIHSENKKKDILGIILGILLIVISVLFE
jgi:ZIP family zinc transporter